MSRSEGLRVWDAAREFAEEVSVAAKDLPRHAPAGLRAQFASSAHSISSNIAEGVGRGSPGEKLQFARVARGSVEESQNYLRICGNLGLIERATFFRLWNRAVVIARMLSVLIARLERS